MALSAGLLYAERANPVLKKRFHGKMQNTFARIAEKNG